MTHSIRIDGTTYGNVGAIEPIFEEETYFDVTTLDGKKHKRVRYTKTNYKVTFFNLLDGVYDSLKTFIKANKNEQIQCAFPLSPTGWEYTNYRLTIEKEIAKGYHNGVYYRNGLEVLFERVNAENE